jgi:predicted pyridoxine 5'-phosphate oxidase superfamily flavin-nucleotide-binding protein
MPLAFADIAFTPAVRAEQERKGSARAYSNMLAPDADGGDRLSPDEADFLTARDGFYQATVSESGWPYVQFRGGSPGFLQVLDDRTIAYADYAGNRQYISTGNLAGDDRVSIIAIDYPNQRRLKVWGHAQLSDDPEIIAGLARGYGRRIERAVVIRIAAFDWNCPKHIPRRMTADEMGPTLSAHETRISDLLADNRALRAQLSDPAR